MGTRWMGLATAAMVAWAAQGLPASAELVPWKAELTGAAQVPPVASEGKGTLEASYDSATKILIWTITYSGLSGPVTSAHIHGPVDPGKTGPIVIPISGPFTSPIRGQATLTPEQADSLKRGVYVDLHTGQNPEGEVRGELK
jgi:hypothetical protein